MNLTCPTCYVEVKEENMNEHARWHGRIVDMIRDAERAIWRTIG